MQNVTQSPQTASQNPRLWAYQSWNGGPDFAHTHDCRSVRARIVTQFPRTTSCLGVPGGLENLIENWGGVSMIGWPSAGKLWRSLWKPHHILHDLAKKNWQPITLWVIWPNIFGYPYHFYTWGMKKLNWWDDKVPIVEQLCMPFHYIISKLVAEFFREVDPQACQVKQLDVALLWKLHIFLRVISDWFNVK